MVKAKAFIFKQRFDGFPKESDLELVEEELPPIKDGEFLAEAVYLSVDPYQRSNSRRIPHLGVTFIGAQVAKIIESKNDKYPVGKYVVGEFGWRTHTIAKDEKSLLGFPAAWLIPDFEGLPLSLALGILGMPGNTAYFGFLEICNPKPGETVVVTGAAGAVGSIVGQMAKIKGARVIGVTGSDEKGQRLINDLKFDAYVNYNSLTFEEELAKVASKGIDCYFDNVGGEISSTIMDHMNLFGRISVCGAISLYNEKEVPKSTTVQYKFVSKQLKMEGFHVLRWWDRWFEGIEANQKWIKEGKLVYRETVTEGFENMFKAFADMLRGANYGKAIVKV